MTILTPEEVDEIQCHALMLEMMNAHIHHQNGCRPVRLAMHKDDLSTDAGVHVRDIAERYEHSHIIVEFGAWDGPKMSFCNAEDVEKAALK